MVSKIFIEGDNSEVQAPTLREAFSKLINSKLGDRKIRIKMGGGVEQTCKAFLHTKEEACLLIDLHGPAESKSDDLKKRNLELKSDWVFYMIQSMEAWFLSQSDILDEHFGTGDKIHLRFKAKAPMHIAKPGDELNTLVTNAKGKKKDYHKTRDGAEILMKLKADKLYTNFPDFKNLIDKLNSR